MKRTILIVCGGTGGHLTPGIAMAEELTSRGFTCRLILSRKQVDARLSKKYTQLHFVAAPGVPFSRKPLGFLRFLASLFAGLWFAWRLCRRERPEAVLAFGGFMSVGFVIIGWLQGAVILLHEANRRAGRSTRVLSRLAHRVYLPEGLLLPNLRRHHMLHVGMPLRREIVHHPKEEARRQLDIPLRDRLLVVFGGSQGAEVLNHWARRNLDYLLQDNIMIYCLTGPTRATEGVIEVRSDPDTTRRIWFVPFSDQIAQLLSAADLVVSRAGAGSIAEIIACQAPAILVPYPHAADNHQEANARYLEQGGGCIVLPQTDMKRLLHEVQEVIFNDWMLHRLRENLRLLQRGSAAVVIADDLQRILREREPVAPSTPLSATPAVI